jgi:hypothetical protein
MRWRGTVVVATIVLAARTAGAQVDLGTGGDTSRYESQYGVPVDVSLYDLSQNPESYRDRAVRTHGRLETVTSTGAGFNSYQISDGAMAIALIVPVREIAGEFEDHARQWLGQEVELTGAVFLRSVQTGLEPRVAIQFWSFEGPPPPEVKGPIKAETVRLEDLVTRPGSKDGRTIRVVGAFRGRNLFGDLPSRSQRRSADWVVKDDVYAVWVTDKKPKGAGWELDAGLKRDTGKWIEVIGRPDTIGNVTYIKAVRVALTTAPSATAKVEAPPPPPERPKKAPVVVFSLPVEGLDLAPPDGRFVVQFSQDMDARSFDGRVQLRYVGPVRAGARTFEGLRMTYDPDVEGLLLTPRPGHEVDGAADVLRYQTGT